MPANTFSFSFDTQFGSYRYVIKSKYKKNTTTQVNATIESNCPISNKSFDNKSETISTKKDVQISSLKSDENPITIIREAKLKEGETLKVHFDENVAVYVSGVNSKSCNCKETFFDKIRFKNNPKMQCPKLPSFLKKKHDADVAKIKRGAALNCVVFVCVILLIIII
eukprot:UN08742